MISKAFYSQEIATASIQTNALTVFSHLGFYILPFASHWNGSVTALNSFALLYICLKDVKPRSSKTQKIWYIWGVALPGQTDTQLTAHRFHWGKQDCRNSLHRPAMSVLVWSQLWLYIIFKPSTHSSEKRSNNTDELNDSSMFSLLFLTTNFNMLWLALDRC